MFAGAASVGVVVTQSDECIRRGGVHGGGMGSGVALGTDRNGWAVR